VIIVSGCLAAMMLLAVGYLWLPGGGLRIFSGLHHRADQVEHAAPTGLTLVRRQDHGTAYCPLECGGAYTTLVYSGPGLDNAQLCAAGEAKLTELFGPADVVRPQPGGCGPHSWRLAGVYKDLAHATLTTARGTDVGVAGSDLVLVVTLDSGRR